MSTTVIPRRPERGGYRFTDVARMEWIKLRTLRSTGWITLILAAGMLGLAVLVMSQANYAKLSAADRASFDPTELAFVGLALGQLLVAVLGVLAITSEFSSGMIRATLAAAPRRPMVLAAKAAVLGVAGLAVGEVLAFAAFLAGQAALASPAPHATLAQPGVLRAVLMAGAYLCLMGLIGLGIGAIIRHTAGAIATVVGRRVRAPGDLPGLPGGAAARRGEVPAHDHRGELAHRGQARVTVPAALGRAGRAGPVRRDHPGRRRLAARPPGRGRGTMTPWAARFR